MFYTNENILYLNTFFYSFKFFFSDFLFQWKHVEIRRKFRSIRLRSKYDFHALVFVIEIRETMTNIEKEKVKIVINNKNV